MLYAQKLHARLAQAQQMLKLVFVQLSINQDGNRLLYLQLNTHQLSQLGT
jgi:hypothetical protein